MPNRPEHSQKMKDCVQELGAKGTTGPSAYAICTASLQKKGTPIFAGAEAGSDEEMRLLAEEQINEMRLLHLVGATGDVRHGVLNGIEYLIVPVTALMEGAIHAVNAPTAEFVPVSVLQRAPQSWNGRPVVLGHPTENGRQVSANDPKVLEKYQIGALFETKCDNRRLLTEAWIDPVRTLNVAKGLGIDGEGLLKNLREKKAVEVSVGAFVTTTPQAGSHNGRAYKAVWNEGILPDHLAFLPNGRGACSVEMGCGTHRAAEEPIETYLVTAEGLKMVGEPETIVTLHLDETKIAQVVLGGLKGDHTMKEEPRALSPLGDKAQVGMSVKVNSVGHPLHGKKAKITALKKGNTVATVEADGKSYTMHGSQLKAAQETDTPEEAQSEEDAELIGYSTMKTLVGQASDTVDQIASIVDELIADETESPTETPEEEDAEEEVEEARLTAIQSLCGSAYSSLSGIMSMSTNLLTPDADEMSPPRYMAKALGELTTQLRTALGARHSTYDNTLIQGLHDNSVKLGADCPGNLSMNGYEAYQDILSLEDFKLLRDISTEERKAASDSDFAGPHRSFPILKAEDVDAAAHSLGRAKGDTGPIKAKIIAIAKRKGFPLPDAWKEPTAARDISTEERKAASESDFAGPNRSFPILKPEDVSAAAHSLGRASGDPSPIKANIIKIAKRKGASFVAQLPDTWKKEEGIKAAAETADSKAAAGTSTLSTLRAACSCRKGERMTAEQKKEIVAALTANKHSGFMAGDEATLEGFPDERLESFLVAAEARENEVKAAQEAAKGPKTLSAEEFMKAAPPELVSLISRQQRQQTERKADLVTALKAAQDEFSESQLAAMPLEQLETYAKLAKVYEQPDYSGRAIPRAAADKTGDVFSNPPDPYAAGLEKLRAAMGR